MIQNRILYLSCLESQTSILLILLLEDSELLYRNVPLSLGSKALAIEGENSLFGMIKTATTKKKKNVGG